MILKLTVVAPPLVPLAFCVICPVWFGTNNSSPCSPTNTGFPFDTAPPDALAPLKKLPIALNILPPPFVSVNACCFCFSLVINFSIKSSALFLARTSIKALNILGTNDVEFLNLPDNTLKKELTNEKLIEKLKLKIKTYNPEIVFTHSDDDYHPAHRNIGKLIKKIGNMQKAVVLYRPLPKLLETLRKSGLAKFVKIDKKLKDSKNVEEAKTKGQIEEINY